MGPEGGSGGGLVVAEGTPEQVAENPDSYTGVALAEVLDSLKNSKAPKRVEPEPVAIPEAKASPTKAGPAAKLKKPAPAESPKKAEPKKPASAKSPPKKPPAKKAAPTQVSKKKAPAQKKAAKKAPEKAEKKKSGVKKTSKKKPARSR
jgi:excinuclease ABC subunit A